MSDLKLVELYKSNCSQVAPTMRLIADEIESVAQKEDQVIETCIIARSALGEIEVYGLGDCDVYHCMALLSMAKAKLVNTLMGVQEL